MKNLLIAARNWVKAGSLLTFKCDENVTLIFYHKNKKQSDSCDPSVYFPYSHETLALESIGIYHLRCNTSSARATKTAMETPEDHTEDRSVDEYHWLGSCNISHMLFVTKRKKTVAPPNAVNCQRDEYIYTNYLVHETWTYGGVFMELLVGTPYASVWKGGVVKTPCGDWVESVRLFSTGQPEVERCNSSHGSLPGRTSAVIPNATQLAKLTAKAKWTNCR